MEGEEELPNTAPWVCFERADGRRVRLGPGGIIGRSPASDLPILDPHVSVAHAGVSLRAGRLCLLGYRGRVWVDGVEHRDVELSIGAVIGFPGGSALRIVDLHLPDEFPALQVEGGPEFTVDQATWHVTEEGWLRPGHSTEHPTLWEADGTWYCRVDDEPVELVPGEWLDTGRHRVRLALQEPGEAGETSTEVAAELPVTIHSYAEETVIQVGDASPVHLHRTSHAVVRELGRLTAAEGRAVHWTDVAERVWRGEKQKLDRLWQQKRSRMRHEFLRHGLPLWLIRTSDGLVRLQLRPEDSFSLHDEEA